MKLADARFIISVFMNNSYYYGFINNIDTIIFIFMFSSKLLILGIYFATVGRNSPLMGERRNSKTSFLCCVTTDLIKHFSVKLYYVTNRCWLLYSDIATVYFTLKWKYLNSYAELRCF